jgi:hypothetical protein
LVCLMMTGCFEDSDCTTDYTNVAKVRFYSKITNETEEQNFLSVFIQENDSILGSNTNTANYRLPLKPGAESAGFRFDGDSLVLGYRSRAFLKGLNCDPEQVYDQLVITTTSFDSVVIVNDILDVEIDENIRVYR